MNKNHFVSFMLFSFCQCKRKWKYTKLTPVFHFVISKNQKHACKAIAMHFPMYFNVLTKFKDFIDRKIRFLFPFSISEIFTKQIPGPMHLWKSKLWRCLVYRRGLSVCGFKIKGVRTKRCKSNTRCNKNE